MAGAFFKPKKTATLFRDAPPPSGLTWRENESDFAGAFLREKLLRFEIRQGSYLLAFIFVWLFTLALYLRPQELFPTFFEAYPVQFAKLFATTAPLIYFASRLLGGEKLFLWETELKMAFAILGLGLLFYPISIEPADTWKEINDLYLKVVLIFGLLIGTLDSRSRIYWMMRVTVLTGLWIAIDSILKYKSGVVSQLSNRIEGTVGGMFSNPNDLATTFGMLMPLAVVLLVVSRGPTRILYGICVFVFALATLITFSRGGFLSLLAVVGVMLWKFRKRHKAIPYVAALMLGGTLFLSLPGGLGERLWTIVKPDSDSTGSAQERRDILKRGVVTFARHPVTGIGLGTFHIISIKERRAHNSYLEIAAELGMLGLLAYLILLFNPLKALWKIESETVSARDQRDFENYVLSVGLQATLVAYYANSFFASIQYQWFVYFPLAYAVGLRRIYQREQAIREQVEAPAHLADHHIGDQDKGTFWKTRYPGHVFQELNQREAERQTRQTVAGATPLALPETASPNPTPASQRQLPPPSTNG